MSGGHISSNVVILGTPLYLKHRKKHVLNIPAQTEIVKTHVTHNKQNINVYLAACRISFPNCTAQNTKLKPGYANSFCLTNIHFTEFCSRIAMNTVASDLQIRSSASTPRGKYTFFYHFQDSTYSMATLKHVLVRIHVRIYPH